MIPPGRRVVAGIQDAVTRHLPIAIGVFCAGVLLGALAVVFSPGGARVAVAGIAVAAALILAAVILWLIDARNPYFRSRQDIQETLNLPVLAVYPENRRGVYPVRGRR